MPLCCRPAAAHVSACQRKCAQQRYRPLCVSWQFDGATHTEAFPNRCWLDCYNAGNPDPARIVRSSVQVSGGGGRAREGGWGGRGPGSSSAAPLPPPPTNRQPLPAPLPLPSSPQLPAVCRTQFKQLGVMVDAGCLRCPRPHRSLLADEALALAQEQEADTPAQLAPEALEEQEEEEETAFAAGEEEQAAFEAGEEELEAAFDEEGEPEAPIEPIPQLASRRALKSLSPCQRACARKPFAPLCARLPSTGLTMAFANPCMLACASQDYHWRVMARHIQVGVGPRRCCPCRCVCAGAAASLLCSGATARGPARRWLTSPLPSPPPRPCSCPPSVRASGGWPATSPARAWSAPSSVHEQQPCAAASAPLAQGCAGHSRLPPPAGAGGLDGCRSPSAWPLLP